jgi:predicted transcriptional regulator
MTVKPRKKYPYKPSKSSKTITIRLSNEAYAKLERMHKKTGYTPHDYLKRRIEYDLTRKHGKAKKKAVR